MVVVLFVFLNGCNEKNKTDLKKVSLRQEWFPYSGYAGEVFAINKFDSLNGIELDLVPGAENIDPIKMVLSGENTFGVVSADRILSANDKGADLVVIGVINYISPTCFIAKEESNIKSPKDFEGKRIGILSGTNTEYVYKMLVKKQGLNLAKIKEIEIPFDLGTFLTNAYDVRPAFIYDEPVSLDIQNVKYSIIDPTNYGVSFIGTVYFTRQKTINDNPQIVQSFVNSIASGWEAAIENPTQAIEYLKQFDNSIDEVRERKALEKGLSHFKGEDGKILFASVQSWNRMIEYLKELSLIDNIDIGKYINYTFLENYYRTKK